MKNRLLLTMIALISFNAVQANPWDDFKETAKAVGKITKDILQETGESIKENTWNKKIGNCKNGGKVVIISIAVLLATDQIYHWYVNKKIKEEWEKNHRSPAQVTLPIQSNNSTRRGK